MKTTRTFELKARFHKAWTAACQSTDCIESAQEEVIERFAATELYAYIIAFLAYERQDLLTHFAS